MSDGPADADGAVADYETAQSDLCEHYGLDVASEYVAIDGIGEVQCLVAGDPDGEPVVFVHGADTAGAVWLPLLAALDLDGRHVVVPDAPGFGRSAPFEYWDVDLRSLGAQFVAGTVDALGHDSATVVAHSFGGYLALATALDRPERVDALAFVSAPLGVYEGLPLPFRLMSLPLADRLLYRFVFGGPDQTASNQRVRFERTMLKDGSHLPDSLFECLAATNRVDHCRRARRSLVRSSITIRGVPDELVLADELPAIEQPVLFAWGGDDDLVPNGTCRVAADRMPDAECRVLDGHGHAVWLERDSEAPSLVDGFLREQVSRRPHP